MSLSVPTGNKPLTDAELAQLATSPTWPQSPNGWFDRSANDEDDHLHDGRSNDDDNEKFAQPGFLDDIDGMYRTGRFSSLSLPKHTYTQSPFFSLHLAQSVPKCLILMAE